MSNRPKGLGRGIGALLPSSKPSTQQAAPAIATAAAAGAASELPIALIDPNPEQPRQIFDDEQLQRLADSIRQHGVLQPVVVRRAGERFELIVGERRWRASQLAGRKTIPAVVADIAPSERLAIALIENVQRHDLNPIELAHAFQNLAATGATQEEIGKQVGLDRSSIANHLRLLELPRELQGDVEAGRLSVGHAKALLQTANPELRRRLRDRIIGEGLSVRAVEQLARPSAGAGKKSRQIPTRSGTDPNLQRMLDLLRQRFQTRVRIQGDSRRGRVEVEYFSPDDLTRITDLMLG